VNLVIELLVGLSIQQLVLSMANHALCVHSGRSPMLPAADGGPPVPFGQCNASFAAWLKISSPVHELNRMTFVSL